MSVESAKKFLSDVNSNEELQSKIKNAAGDDVDFDAIIVAVNDAGYDFTKKELEEAVAGEEELGLDELEAVAGGGRCVVWGSGDCVTMAKNCKGFFT